MIKITRNFTLSLLCIVAFYYNYHLFGLVSVKIAKSFLPSKTIQLKYAFAILYFSVLIKPVGAVIFGKIGDFYSRSIAINITLIGVAIGSFIIACLPAQENISYSILAILITARMLVCGCVSPGADGVRIYVYEQINQYKQHMGSAITSILALSGTFIASMCVSILISESLPCYYWRFAFVIGSALAIVMFIVRMLYMQNDDLQTTTNNPDYEKYKNESLISLIRENLELFWLSVLISGGIGFCYQFAVIFWLNYSIVVLQYSETMYNISSYWISIYIIFAFITGYLADKFDPSKITQTGIICLIIIGLCSMYAINLKHQKLVIMLYLLSAIFIPFYIIPSLVALKRGFKLATRYRMFSIVHSFGSITLSASTSFVCMQLYECTSMTCVPFIYFTAIMLCMYLCHRRIHKKYIS